MSSAIAARTVSLIFAFRVQNCLFLLTSFYIYIYIYIYTYIYLPFFFLFAPGRRSSLLCIWTRHDRRPVLDGSGACESQKRDNWVVTAPGAGVRLRVPPRRTRAASGDHHQRGHQRQQQGPAHYHDVQQCEIFIIRLLENSRASVSAKCMHIFTDIQ